MGIATYDPWLVMVLVNGVPLGGFAPGRFVEAHYQDNAFRTIQGSEGESTRTLSLDRSGMVRVTLLQTSDSNRYLNTLAAADRLGGGLGIFDLAIKDVSGGLMIHAPKAWIERPAAAASSAEVGMREWAIAAQQLEMESIGFSLLGNLAAAAQELYDGAVNLAGGVLFNGIPGG